MLLVIALSKGKTLLGYSFLHITGKQRIKTGVCIKQVVDRCGNAELRRWMGNQGQSYDTKYMVSKSIP